MKDVTNCLHNQAMFCGNNARLLDTRNYSVVVLKLKITGITLQKKAHNGEGTGLNK